MKTPQAEMVRAELISRGWSRRDLCSRAGLKSGTLSSVISGEGVNIRARARLETALGRAVWANENDFQSRQLLARFVGDRDPVLVSRGELLKAGNALGFVGLARLSKAALIAALAARVCRIAKVAAGREDSLGGGQS